jgi:hypothetical protein
MREGACPARKMDIGGHVIDYPIVLSMKSRFFVFDCLEIEPITQKPF